MMKYSINAFVRLDIEAIKDIRQKKHLTRFQFIGAGYEKRVGIIFLSPSRTADENNVRVGQEMVLPCPRVPDTGATRVLSFCSVDRQ